jgi:hypothetical protein
MGLLAVRFHQQAAYAVAPKRLVIELAGFGDRIESAVVAPCRVSRAIPNTSSVSRAAAHRLQSRYPLGGQLPRPVKPPLVHHPISQSEAAFGMSLRHPSVALTFGESRVKVRAVNR